MAVVLSDAAGRLADRADAAAGLEISARAVAASVRLGRHAALGAGSGDEFYDYRPVDPSAPTEPIDWRASARREHPVVRRRRHQAPMTLAVVLDVSASMGFRAIKAGRETPSKIDDARIIAASLITLAAGQGDRVRLIVVSGGSVAASAALTRRDALAVSCDAMVAATPTGSSGLSAGLDAVASLAPEADMVAAVSDMLEPIEDMAAALAGMRRRSGPSRDVLVVQTLARDELAPTPRGVRLVDPETGRAVAVRSAESAAIVAQHAARVREITHAIGGRCSLHVVGSAIDATIRRLLTRTSAGAVRGRLT